MTKSKKKCETKDARQTIETCFFHSMELDFCFLKLKSKLRHLLLMESGGCSIFHHSSTKLRLHFPTTTTTTTTSSFWQHHNCVVKSIIWRRESFSLSLSGETKTTQYHARLMPPNANGIVTTMYSHLAVATGNA